jgi:hypothetical protein
MKNIPVSSQEKILIKKCEDGSRLALTETVFHSSPFAS